MKMRDGRAAIEVDLDRIGLDAVSRVDQNDVLCHGAAPIRAPSCDYTRLRGELPHSLGALSPTQLCQRPDDPNGSDASATTSVLSRWRDADQAGETPCGWSGTGSTAGQPSSPVPPAASEPPWPWPSPIEAATSGSSTATPHGLKEVAEDIRARHPALDVKTYEADLAETDSLAELAARIVGDFETVTLLVNNAGVALGGLFTQISLEDFDWVMRINFEATVHLTYELLPALRASPGSHLVNMSSLYGLIAPPGQSAYSASKFAIRGFTEVLRHELPRDGRRCHCRTPRGSAHQDRRERAPRRPRHRRPTSGEVRRGLHPTADDRASGRGRDASSTVSRSAALGCSSDPRPSCRTCWRGSRRRTTGRCSAGSVRLRLRSSRARMARRSARRHLATRLDASRPSAGYEEVRCGSPCTAVPGPSARASWRRRSTATIRSR